MLSNAKHAPRLSHRNLKQWGKDKSTFVEVGKLLEDSCRSKHTQIWSSRTMLFKLFSSWHTNNLWIWLRRTYVMMAKTYCYMDQTFYKLFVKAWNFCSTLQSLSRHT